MAASKEIVAVIPHLHTGPKLQSAVVRELLRTSNYKAQNHCRNNKSEQNKPKSTIGLY